MVGTDPAGGPARPSADNFFLGRAASSAEYFTGRLDEIAVFQGSLSEEEIAGIMENGVLGGGPPAERQALSAVGFLILALVLVAASTVILTRRRAVISLRA